MLEDGKSHGQETEQGKKEGEYYVLNRVIRVGLIEKVLLELSFRVMSH